MKRVVFKFVLVFSLVSIFISPTLADEGMWLPMFLERLNYVDMQKDGLQLTAEELYSINNTSLKDAIVGWGSVGRPSGFGCTAEVISAEGLLMTNHHCGYGDIQSLSTDENNILKNGFWAMNRKEELVAKDRAVSFLVRMEDVTKEVLKGIKIDDHDTLRESLITERTAKIQKEASEDGKFNTVVKSFFDGNEYYLMVYQMYKDVRLVGAPPASVGKYGGDTDNWMWPRHTCDFSMFRIYSAPDGSPAEYSKDNIPLNTKHHLPISLKGVKKDDFAMVWGFPGRTNRFLTSHGVKLALEQSNPTVVKIRDKKLAILRQYMGRSPKVKLQYAAKYASSANYWKYFRGQSKGLIRLKVYDQKKKIEDGFMAWVNASEDRNNVYGNSLPSIEGGYSELEKINISYLYLNEACRRGAELLTFPGKINTLYSELLGAKKKENTKENFIAAVEGHFKNYSEVADKQVFIALLKMAYDNIETQYHPPFFSVVAKKYKGDFEAYADYVYGKTMFADKDKLMAFLEKPSAKKIQKDPAYQIMREIRNAGRVLFFANSDIMDKINKGNRLYVKGLLEMNSEEKYYPNANSTMRFTYGKVLDYIPADAVHYDYFTTLDGVMEKEDSTNHEFVVPKKLKELYEKKDFGPYAENGELHACFITNNDITGGNSGSPVINAEGHLIGLAFDGNWEAMSGDIAFEHQLQRCINVDIRYVLFIIDKYAGASHLIKEMTIIE